MWGYLLFRRRKLVIFNLPIHYFTKQVPLGLSHHICGNCPWHVQWYVATATCVFANLLCDTGHEIDVCVLKCRNVLGGSLPTLTPVSRPVINSGSASRPFLKYHSRGVIHKRAGQGQESWRSRPEIAGNQAPDRTALAQASPGAPRGRPDFPPSSSRPPPPRRPAPPASAPELRPGRPGPLRTEKGHGPHPARDSAGCKTASPVSWATALHVGLTSGRSDVTAHAVADAEAEFLCITCP